MDRLLLDVGLAHYFYSYMGYVAIAPDVSSYLKKD